MLSRFPPWALLMAATAAFGAERYKDSVFSTLSVTKNIDYAFGVKTYQGTLDTLSLDFYEPKDDTARARPLIILMHGGGFAIGSKSAEDIVLYCRTFSQRGYATASIDYRLNPDAQTLTRKQMLDVVYAAVQDSRAAVRFMRSHRKDFRIDDDRIILMGTSAGGVMALTHAYLDADEVPPLIDTVALGGLDGSGGTPGVSSAITGIINCWGGVADTTILENARVPALHFHGSNDSTVPINTGISLGNPDYVTYGSECIHRNLIRAGAKSFLHVFEGMGHGVYAPDPRWDTIITLSTEFAYKLFFQSAAIRRPPAAVPRAALPQIVVTADGRRKRAVNHAPVFVVPDRTQ